MLDSEEVALSKMVQEALLNGRQKSKIVEQAKAVADEQAAELRRRGGSRAEIEAEWQCWFEEELRLRGYGIIKV
jgi:hypothetical protein